MQRSRLEVGKTEAVAKNGMVTAMHPLAAEAGLAILERGGNAADAAVAAGFAIGVVEPFMSGAGGVCCALVHDAEQRRTRCFDGCAVVPREASPEMFELSPAGETSLGLYGWRATKDQASETGYRAVAAPATTATLTQVHREHGGLALDEVMEPAIRLAEEGYLLDWYVFSHIAASMARLRPFPETSKVFYASDGTPLVPAEFGEPSRLKQPALAGTLRRIAHEGGRSLYEGDMAEALVRHIRSHGGILTLDDLASYQVRVREALSIDYQGHRIALAPANSGGPTVALMLQIVEALSLDPDAPDLVEQKHGWAEALRLAYDDRFRHMGDPDFQEIALAGLGSKAYAASRAEKVSLHGRRMDPLPIGDPWAFQSRPGGPRPRQGSGDAASGHTTHVNVVDKDQNVVSITSSLGARFGSGVLVPELGLVLNNGLMWFDPEPGRLASIEPGKRALHAAAPAIVFREDEPIAVVGSPGARRIMAALSQVLSNVIDSGMSVGEAVCAPRLHGEVNPPLVLDDRFPESLGLGLAERGHVVERKAETYLSSLFARPSGILIDREEGVLRGGVEPFKVSAAVGY